MLELSGSNTLSFSLLYVQALMIRLQVANWRSLPSPSRLHQQSATGSGLDNASRPFATLAKHTTHMSVLQPLPASHDGKDGYGFRAMSCTSLRSPMVRGSPPHAPADHDRPVTEQLAAGKGPKEASERHSIDRWTRASGGWGSTSFSAVPCRCCSGLNKWAL